MSQRIQLKTTLLRAALTSVLLSVLVVGIISLLLTRRYLLQEIQSRHSIVSKLVGNQLDMLFREGHEDATRLKRLLETDHLRSLHQDPIGMRQVLNAFQDSSTLFHAVYLLDSSGQVLATAPHLVGQLGTDMSGDPLVMATMRDRTTRWSTVFVEAVQGQPVLSLIMKVGSGVLVFHFSLDRLSQFSNRLDLGQGAILSIVDQSGAYIIHPDFDLVKVRDVFPKFKQMQDQATEGVFNGSLEIEGRSWLCLMRKDVRSGWSVIIKQDESLAFAPVRTLGMALSLTSLVLLGILAWFSTSLFRGLLAPLGHFVDRIKALAQGDYTPQPRYEAYEEFDELSRQFSLMAEKVRQRQQQFESLAESLTSQLNLNERSEKAFRAIMSTVSTSTGEDLLRSIAKGVQVWLGADLAFVGEYDLVQNKIKIKAFSDSDGRQTSPSYSVLGTPSEIAISEGFYHQPYGALLRFVNDTDLQILGMDGYAGIAIKDQDGNLLGILSVMGKNELSLPSNGMAVMQILANRCAAEFQRLESLRRQETFNQSLAQMAQSLTAKNKEFEGMVYIASHDLRSPLVNISGFSQELRVLFQQVHQQLSQHNTHPELTRMLQSEAGIFLDYIQNSVSRMDSLLNGLLRLSRVGRTDLNIVPLPMNPLIAKVLADVGYQIQEHGIKVEVEDLPSCMGSETEVQQVFANLIGNAIKYQDPRRALRLHISGEYSGGRAIYRIKDNGRGIAPHNIHRIFQIFFRDGNNDLIVGEGLGLTIVQRILERLQGVIQVESDLGKGSIFTVTLPAAPH